MRADGCRIFTLQQRVLQSRNFTTRARRRRPFVSRIPSHNDDDSLVKSSSLDVSDKSSETKLSTQVKELVESSQAFVARDKDGNELSMDEYLKFASLSPWVPCPDVVAKKVLDIAQVGTNDVHYELGSGDGRVNFHAIDSSYNVKKSVGIDIDSSLIKSSNERIAKRHPRPQNIEFICADLLDSSDLTSTIWSSINKDCTILTMYFVEDALLKLKPILEQNVVPSCKVVTVGYEMKGWDADWVETILGLKVHLYNMEGIKKKSLFEGIPGEEFSGNAFGVIDNMDTLEQERNMVDGDLPRPEYPEPDTNENIPFHWDDFNDIDPSEENEKSKN